MTNKSLLQRIGNNYISSFLGTMNLCSKHEIMNDELKETNNKERLTYLCVSASSSRFAGRLDHPDGAEASKRLPDGLLTQRPVGGSSRGRGVTFDLGHGRAESTDDVEPSGVEAVARQSLQGHDQVQRGLVDGSLDLHRNQEEQ